MFNFLWLHATGIRWGTIFCNNILIFRVAPKFSKINYCGIDQCLERVFVCESACGIPRFIIPSKKFAIQTIKPENIIPLINTMKTLWKLVCVTHYVMGSSARKIWLRQKVDTIESTLQNEYPSSGVVIVVIIYKEMSSVCIQIVYTFWLFTHPSFFKWWHLWAWIFHFKLLETVLC